MHTVQEYTDYPIYDNSDDLGQKYWKNLDIMFED
jgi:hypothetical protein